MDNGSRRILKARRSRFERNNKAVRTHRGQDERPLKIYDIIDAYLKLSIMRGWGLLNNAKQWSLHPPYASIMHQKHDQPIILGRITLASASNRTEVAAVE